MSVTLVLGGARSGKSAYAERLAAASAAEVVYIATAQAGDGEMAERIAHHRDSRPAHWSTIEEPLGLSDAIERQQGRTVLVDCLTLWLSNLIFAGPEEQPDDSRIVAERERLVATLARAQGNVILVSNEVGMGIVPMGAVTRLFVDEAGRLNQAVAAVAERVVFVAAGLPLYLKGAPC
jgi:adenosylcobinamide kinase/adenosylcobinamide-phosphate guanylyltransferase